MNLSDKFQVELNYLYSLHSPYLRLKVEEYRREGLSYYSIVCNLITDYDDAKNTNKKTPFSDSLYFSLCKLLKNGRL